MDRGSCPRPRGKPSDGCGRAAARGSARARLDRARAGRGPRRVAAVHPGRGRQSAARALAAGDATKRSLGALALPDSLQREGVRACRASACSCRAVEVAVGYIAWKVLSLRVLARRLFLARLLSRTDRHQVLALHVQAERCLVVTVVAIDVGAQRTKPCGVEASRELLERTESARVPRPDVFRAFVKRVAHARLEVERERVAEELLDLHRIAPVEWRC